MHWDNMVGMATDVDLERKWRSCETEEMGIMLPSENVHASKEN